MRRVISYDHVHMHVENPERLSVSDLEVGESV